MKPHEVFVAAASEALEDLGVDGLTVREVARRAKQSTIGIYRHFSGKPGLLDALFRRGFEQLGEAAQEAGEREANAHDAVLATVGAYLDLAHSHPQHYRLMFAPATAGYAPTAEARAFALDNYARFVALVERLPGHAYDARRVAADLFALVHGHVALRAQALGPALAWDEWAGRIAASVDRQLAMLERN
ncbi:MAG: TetR/AcrR family transcriptional regulator [Alteraurantiacibacter sp.]